MTTVALVFNVIALSISLVLTSCPQRESKKDEPVTSDDSTSIQSDIAHGCAGTIYHVLDSNSLLIVKFDPDVLQLNMDYVFNLLDSTGLVKVYIDKYEEDGVWQSYCSDIIVTNALEPVKIPVRSGILKLKLSAQHVDASVENLEFVQPHGEVLRIANKRFIKVKMETGG